MKRIKLIIMVFIMFFTLTSNGYAYSKDIEVKYEKSTNVSLKKATINNNSVSLTIDNNNFQISSPLNNVEVVIIKVKDEAYSYINSKTNSNQNYYLSFYQNNKKINNPNIKIKINSTNKTLNIFNNEGILLEKNSNYIALDKNDYFAIITDKINLENEKFQLIEVGTFIDDIKNIVINNNAVVEVYNSKNQKIDINTTLGTDYRIIVKNGNEIKEYIIITSGDITGDAEIDFFDVTRLYHKTKGITELKDTYEIAGDFAKDGSIDFIDVTKLYHHTKGITPKV